MKIIRKCMYQFYSGNGASTELHRWLWSSYRACEKTIERNPRGTERRGDGQSKTWVLIKYLHLESLFKSLRKIFTSQTQSILLHWCVVMYIRIVNKHNGLWWSVEVQGSHSTWKNESTPEKFNKYHGKCHETWKNLVATKNSPLTPLKPYKIN